MRSDGVGASTPRRQTRPASGIAWHREAVEGMQATCAPPQVPSPPRTGPAARGESQAREVAPARAHIARVHGCKQNNEKNVAKNYPGSGRAARRGAASGQYGDGIRRAPCFHNAKHVKLT